MNNKNKNKNDIPEKIDRAVDDSDSVFDIIFNLDDGTYTTTSREEEDAAAAAFAENIESAAVDAAEETREQVEDKAGEIAEELSEAEETVREEAVEAVSDVAETGAAVEAGAAAVASEIAAEITDDTDFTELEGFEDDIEGEEILSDAGEELSETLSDSSDLVESAAGEAAETVDEIANDAEEIVSDAGETVEEGVKSAGEKAEQIEKAAEDEIREAGAEAFKVRDEADQQIASLNGRMREISSEENDRPQKSTVKGLAMGGMLVISEDEEENGEEEAADEFAEMRENVTDANDTVRSDKIKNLAGDPDMNRNDNVASKLRGILGLSGTEGGGKTLLGMNYAMWSMIILLVFVFDAVLMNFVLHKVIYPIVSNVMTASGAASLQLDSYETLYTGISYGIAFLVGGLVLFLISKIAQMLMEEVETSNPGNLIKFVLFGLMIIFGIGGLIAMLVTHKGLFSLAAYRWLCPFMGYAGGLLFFLFSEIGKKKK